MSVHGVRITLVAFETEDTSVFCHWFSLITGAVTLLSSHHSVDCASFAPPLCAKPPGRENNDSVTLEGGSWRQDKSGRFWNAWYLLGLLPGDPSPSVFGWWALPCSGVISPSAAFETQGSIGDWIWGLKLISLYTNIHPFLGAILRLQFCVDMLCPPPPPHQSLVVDRGR